MARRAAAIVAAAALPLLSAAACSSGGADKALERTASWAATARMVAESRAAGATSHQYARVALHAAHAELTTAVKSLDEALKSPDKAGALSPDQRARSLDQARTVEESVGAMVNSAEDTPSDVTTLERHATRAAWAGDAAKALADSAKGK